MNREIEPADEDVGAVFPAKRRFPLPGTRRPYRGLPHLFPRTGAGIRLRVLIIRPFSKKSFSSPVLFQKNPCLPRGI